MEKPIIKKLNEIYRLGYIASRSDQPYSFMVDETTPVARLCNCFGHACFNLKNEHYVKYNLTPTETDLFCKHIEDVYQDTPKIVSERLFNVIKSTGLQIEPCSEKSTLKNNQWKVALYFDYFKSIMCDYHFMLQEKDGRWSSKMGKAYKLDKFNKLDNEVYCFYKLYGVFSITNPYVQPKEIESKLFEK